MNTHDHNPHHNLNHNPDHSHSAAQLTLAPTLEVVMSRAVDGCTSHADWSALEAAGERDPQVWRRLALAHRDHAQLSLRVQELVARADAIEVSPADDTKRLVLHSAHTQRDLLHHHTREPRLGSLRSWGGWAAAAMLTVALVISRTGQPEVIAPLTQGGVGTQANASLGGGISSAADALSQYLTKGKTEGRVLGEVPDKVLVESTPLMDGQGYEVVYVRQIVERAHVPDLYRFSHDESGTARAVPVPARELRSVQPRASRGRGAQNAQSGQYF
jgi:hypothetical protein